MTSYTPLLYDNVGQFEPLPEWGEFLLNLGRAVKKQEDCIVVGLAIPTRAYAAALVATGAMITAAGVSPDDLTVEQHKERLGNLTEGSEVKYLGNNRKIRGMFRGWEIEKGICYFVIRVSSTEAHWIPPQGLKDIEVTGKSIGVPKRGSSRGGKNRPKNDFLSSLLGDCDISTFVRKSRLECVLLGRINSLHHEICEARFAAENFEGTLNDILRVRQFLGKVDAYRAEVLSASSIPNLTTDSTKPLIIFDGAAGYLKWRDRWRGSSQIVLLDRTDRSFDSAINTLKQRYATRFADAQLTLPDAPEGVEVVVFQEES